MFLQARPHKLTAHPARLALVAIVIVASTYLRPFTVHDNDALPIAISTRRVRRTFATASAADSLASRQKQI